MFASLLMLNRHFQMQLFCWRFKDWIMTEVMAQDRYSYFWIKPRLLFNFYLNFDSISKDSKRNWDSALLSSEMDGLSIGQVLALPPMANNLVFLWIFWAVYVYFITFGEISSFSLIQRTLGKHWIFHSKQMCFVFTPKRVNILYSVYIEPSLSQSIIILLTPKVSLIMCVGQNMFILMCIMPLNLYYNLLEWGASVLAFQNL